MEYYHKDAYLSHARSKWPPATFHNFLITFWLHPSAAFGDVGADPSKQPRGKNQGGSSQWPMLDPILTHPRFPGTKHVNACKRLHLVVHLTLKHKYGRCLLQCDGWRRKKKSVPRTLPTAGVTTVLRPKPSLHTLNNQASFSLLTWPHVIRHTKLIRWKFVQLCLNCGTFLYQPFNVRIANFHVIIQCKTSLIWE